MPDIVSLIQQGQGHAFLFACTAVALGFLHGLEPGHSKTMMAAFIIAVRGTVGQAVLLGVSTAFSHSLVVWAVALVGLTMGSKWNAEGSEAYFQIASGVAILGMAAWMGRQLWKQSHRHHHHHHGHDHDHGHHHHHEGEILDDHARAHAADIERRFGNGSATTGQTIVFGLTGGLVPCPASITVLMVCLQLKKVALGTGLVLCFSFGLALTMVLSGVLAALSLRHLAKKWDGFGSFSQKAPWASFVLILVMGVFFLVQGVRHLA